jgi:exodeoxyribonuclease VII large subunit
MLNIDAASVSDLVHTIKGFLEDEFSEVMVQGEVTNLSPSSAGHWYFTLSDEDAAISCALFKTDALRNSLIRTVKNGDKIIVLGPISVFQKRGTFQILAKRIFPAGEGQLKVQFDRLKAKLAQEGLFDLERKKPIPQFPKRIAVITAEHGAALQDFLNVIERRSIWTDILIIPAVVQGADSPRSLVSALKKAQAIPDIDVIVLTRGGGSLEDLWSFNDEGLVREIDQCPIPVISAVGHQVDFSLADYVADHRSETPTAAAELLSQPQTELKGRLHFCQTHLRSGIIKLGQEIQILVQKFHPRELLNIIKDRVQDSVKLLNQFQLETRGPELLGIREESQKLDELSLRLFHHSEKSITKSDHRLERMKQVLDALNPKNVLGRGYSYLEADSGQVVTNVKEFDRLASNTKIQIHFKDGSGSVRKE